MFLTEYVWIDHPSKMHLLYIGLIIPVSVVYTPLMLIDYLLSKTIMVY